MFPAEWEDTEHGSLQSREYRPSKIDTPTRASAGWRAEADSTASGYTCLRMATTDRNGLEVTTSSAVAAERFQEGMDRMLSYGAGADESFAAALQADERLAVAHTGLAVALAPRAFRVRVWQTTL